MKPDQLIMQNIGPFRSETVDFSKLENMFLVSGKTGAGKTTIFDAMVFALYGEFCGSRKNKSRQFRSDFSGQDEHASVEFTFTLNGEKYRVHRTLPETYRNRNGNESVRSSSVSLEQYADNNWNLFNGGTVETNARIAGIIGLTASEFEQIVVLPQGAFAEFLHEGSRERRDTLAKLFPVDLYSRIALQAKETGDKFAEQERSLVREISEFSQNFDAETAEKRRTDLEKEIAALQNDRNTYNESLRKFSAEKERLNTAYDAAVTAENLLNRKAALESRKTQFDEMKARLEQSVQAEKLGEYIRAVRKSADEYSRMAERKNAAELSAKAADGRTSQLLSRTAEMNQKNEAAKNGEQRISRLTAQLSLVEKYLQAARNLTGSVQQRDRLKTELQSLQNRTAMFRSKLTAAAARVEIPVEKAESREELLTKLLIRQQEAERQREQGQQQEQDARKAAQLKKSAEETEQQLKGTASVLASAERQLENTQHCIDDYAARQKAIEANHAACTLTVLLKPGEPCPVCGSKEHPAPVQPLADTIDLTEKIQTQEDNKKLIAAKISELKSRQAAQQTTLDRLQQDLAEQAGAVPVEDAVHASLQFETTYATVKAACQEAEQLNRQLSENEKNTTNCLEQLSAATSTVAAAEAQANSLREEIRTFSEEKTDGIPDAEELRRQITQLRQTVTGNTACYAEWQKSLSAAENEKSSAQSKFETLHENAAEAEKSAQQARSDLAGRLAASVFSSIEQVEQAQLSPQETESFTASIDRWTEELTAVTAQLEGIKTTGSKPELEKELHNVESEEQRTAEKLSAADQLLQEKTIGQSKLITDIERSRKLEQQLRELKGKSAPYLQLSADLNGTNPKKTPFDAWILGMYFEEVVDYANRRFRDISDGRYCFKLSTETGSGNGYKGLDLLVTDSYTGTDRDTAMLSGGETFMASVSLALALTDVVQAKSGGIRLDSLFIDEGFGSLDSDALDNAIAVLNRLQETRMVGVISHVESMKNAIPSCIEVVKGPAGSKIRQS